MITHVLSCSLPNLGYRPNLSKMLSAKTIQMDHRPHLSANWDSFSCPTLIICFLRQRNHPWMSPNPSYSPCQVPLGPYICSSQRRPWLSWHSEKDVATLRYYKDLVPYRRPYQTKTYHFSIIWGVKRGKIMFMFNWQKGWDTVSWISIWPVIDGLFQSINFFGT